MSLFEITLKYVNDNYRLYKKNINKLPKNLRLLINDHALKKSNQVYSDAGCDYDNNNKYYHWVTDLNFLFRKTFNYGKFKCKTCNKKHFIVQNIFLEYCENNFDYNIILLETNLDMTFINGHIIKIIPHICDQWIDRWILNRNDIVNHINKKKLFNDWDLINDYIKSINSSPYLDGFVKIKEWKKFIKYSP